MDREPVVGKDRTSWRVCDTQTLQVPCAYSELLLAMGGAAGSVQQLWESTVTLVPSGRVMLAGGA